MRRRWKILLWLACVAGVAAVSTPLWLPVAARLAEPWIRQRVLAIASDLLEPRVEIGRFEYRFPLGVDIVDLRIVARDTSGVDTPILEASTVGIVLDRLPLTGPIVFRDFELTGATLRFHATEEGSLTGWNDLLSGRSSAGENQRPVSEIFAIDRIVVRDLDVEYAIEGDDRRMNLDGLDFEIDNKARQGDDRIDLGRGPGWYAIDTHLVRAGLFDITIDGGLDVDTLDAELERLDLDLVLDENSSSHLPPQFQEFLTARRVEGHLDASVSGRFNIDDPRRDDTRFDVTLRPTHFAFDEYLVEIDAASLAGTFESEVLRISPCRVEVFGGTVEIDLKLADEATRGMPASPDDAGGASSPPDEPVSSPNTADRIAAAREATGGLVPAAAFESAFEAAEGIHAVASIEIDGIQLDRIHRIDSEDPSKIAGVVLASFECDLNVGRPIASIGGGGTIDISEGRFTGGAVVKALARVMRIMTLSPKQADRLEAVFTLHDEMLDVSRFAILAGPIGARGNGTYGLVTETLDFRLNAGPLEGLQATAGKLGEAFGAITDRLAKYLVRGTISDPKVTVAPLGLDIFGP